MLRLILLFLLLCTVVSQSRHDLVTTTTTIRPSDRTTDVDSKEIFPPESSLEADEEGPPVIRSLHVTSDLRFRYAVTRVSSRVQNPANISARAQFTVTLPDAAFISGFLMDVKGKVYRAHVKEKEKAKDAYDQAVREGRFAGHVAMGPRDSNQFDVSVNIEAHGKVTFNLTYEQLLPRVLGVYSNVININPKQIVKDMSVTVNIEEPTDIINLVVPELQDISNDVSKNLETTNSLAKIDFLRPNHARVRWAPSAEEQRAKDDAGLSGQFIVKYDVDRETNPNQILVDEGYFVHFFAPDNLPPLKKHAVFVLDYSGSMRGRKIEQLKDAMDSILAELTPSDYFSIVIFHTNVEAWSPNSTSQADGVDKYFVVPASSENIRLAQTYIASFSRLGATNLMGGLRNGLKLVTIGENEWDNESNRPQPILLMLTDGMPNVGESNTETIVKNTKSLNENRCPVYSLAFGDDADFGFLRNLSLSNEGFARKIYKAADASDQLKNFYRTIASPLLRGITFTYVPDQVQNSTATTRKEFPVFLKGSEIVVAGKIDKDVDELSNIGEIAFTTVEGLKKYNMTVSMLLNPKNRTLNPTGHLEKSWAFLKIKQLLDKADSVNDVVEKNRTQAEALGLALQYEFVTPLTSLVVVKPNETETSVGTTEVKPAENKAESSATQPPRWPGILYSRVPAASSHHSHISGATQPPRWPGILYSRVPAASSHHSHISGNSYRSLPASAFDDYQSLFSHSSSGLDASPFRNLGSSGRARGWTTSWMRPIYHRERYMDVSGYNRLQEFERHEHRSSDTRRTTSDLRFESSEERTSPEERHEKLRLGLTGGRHNATQVRKVNMFTVSWLWRKMQREGSTIRIGSKQYTVGINESDASFGACRVDYEGQCRHFKHCALDVFKDDINKFTRYRCPIPGDFLGVCCPPGAA